jgi:hypothetical protein
VDLRFIRAKIKKGEPVIEINIVNKETGEVVQTLNAISMAQSRRLVIGLDLDKYEIVTKEVEE